MKTCVCCGSTKDVEIAELNCPGECFKAGDLVCEDCYYAPVGSPTGSTEIIDDCEFLNHCLDEHEQLDCSKCTLFTKDSSVPGEL